MSVQGVLRPRSLENIKEFWRGEAQQWGDDPRVTIRDHYFRLVEIDTVTKMLRGRKRVLDIGCGTGFSTLFFAGVVDEIIGVDYVDLMVSRARQFVEDSSYFNSVMDQFAFDERPVLRRNVSFDAADILSLQYEPGSFDAVTSSRVLINLPERDLQEKAFCQVARVLQPGALWILVEVTSQGHERMDEIRGKAGLSQLEKYWHNLYMDESSVKSMAQKAGLELLEVKRFETYQFLTKMLHPLVVSPEEPKFMDGFNKAAYFVSKEYPDYLSVKKIGFDTFFCEVFQAALSSYDPHKLESYKQVVSKILGEDINFSGCSHQVLFALMPVRSHGL